MDHYCHYEPGRFPEGEFQLVRGNLFRHDAVGKPAHTDDGALWGTDPIDGPDEGVRGEIYGPTADAGDDATA